MAPTGKRDSSSTSGEPFDVKDLTPYSASAPMLSSGVETQPVPLDSSMSAVAQELHSELPVSVSKELHGDSEPSGIPDVKPGTSRAPVSQSRTVPLEQQRTPVESCCEEENAETSDDGGELGWCGLVDSTEGGSVASGILDRKGKPKSMELKVFRDQGTQEEVIVRPTCEGAKAEPSQHSTAAEDKMSPSQLQKDGSLESTLVLVQELTSVTGLKEAPTPGTPSAQTEELLLMQTRKELLCAGLPEDFLRSKGNTQITADTLLKSTAKVQGMKVSETKLDNRHGSVSKGPTPGSIEYPEVDSITTSSEVSERSPLASREPSMPVHSGSTEGACKEKQCEALKPCPSPLSLLPGNSAISKVDSGKEELCQVSLVWEADDSHRHILGCHAEKHHSPPGSPLAPRSAVAVEPLDENDRISSFTSSSSHGESRTTSPCDVEGNGLMKGSTEKTATSSFHQDDQSKNLASREENGGQFLSPGNEQELHSPVNSKQPEEGGSGHHSGCSGDSPKANTPSNNSVLGGDHKESSASLTPSSADATGVELKEKDLKITSDVQGSLTAHEDHRENSAHVGHPHRQYEESRLFLLVENEEPEWAATVAPRVLKEKIHNKDSTSLVSIVPAGQVSPGNEVSKARSDTGWLPPPPELDSKSESGKTAQTSHAGTPRVGEQSMACEVTEPPPPEGLVVNKVDCECVLNQQVSLNSRDHMKLPTDSPLKTDKEVPQTTSKDFHHSELEDRAHIVADAHIIPIKTKMKDISPPRHKTWRASSDSSTLTLIKPGLLEREGVAGSDVYSKNKVAGFPHESSAVECQNVESQEKYSGHCVNKNVSKEDTCSTCTTAESSAIILEDENSLIKKCEDTFQHNEPHSQGTENAMEGSTANVSYTLEEREPDGREAKGSLQEDNIREEATAGTSANGAPDKISSTTIHIGHSEEGLEGKGQNSPEKTVFCECNISNCTTHGLNQSANIPTPGKLLDQSPNLTFSTFENKNQEETQDQKADEALNCQSNQNRPAGWRKEHVTAKETQGSETVRASNSNKSHNQKDVLAGSTACGSPKKDDLEGSFENALGYEDSKIGMVDAVHTDCCNKPAETVLGRKVCTVDLDSDFPNAPSSTEESLKKDKSCKDKVCKSLENCKIALCADSGAPEVVVSVTDHEPEKRTLGQVDVSFNHVPREKLVQGPSQREPQEMDEGPRQDLNSELAKENSLGGISSKQSVSPRCQDENSVPLGSLRSIERMPSSLSPPENSETDVTDPLGRETDLKIVFKPKEGEIICENAKGFTVLPKIQEGAQRSPRSLSEGASMYMKKDRSEGCQPDTRLTLALEAEAKTKEDSREHQGPRQGHLTFGGESEMTAQEDDPFGSMCKISQTHMKCNRTHSVAEEQPHQEALDSRLKREEEYKHQKRIHGILEQRTSSNTLSDKLQNKSLSEEESAVLEEIALAKLTRDDIAAWARSLNAPKVGSSCHSFKKDVVLCAGRSFPGTPQKAQDPHSAGRGEILGTFGNPAPRTQGLPLKKQPHRTCKRAPCQDQVKVGRKTGKIRSSTFLMSSSEAIPTKEPRLDISGAPPLPARVESKSTPRSLPGHIPKQKAAPCHLSRSLDPRKPTKESALLSKLAILARKLAPDTKTQKLRYWRCSSELLPVARSYKRLRYKRFLDGFSRNTLQLNPYLAASRWDKTPNSKPVALYSLEAIRMNFIDLSSKMPSLLLGTDTHPVCFHVNSGLDSMAQASVTFPEHCAPTRLALGEAPRCSSQPPKWTFSFFFSHGGSGTATFREDTSLQSRTCPRAPPAPLASVQDSGSTTVVQSTAGFSVLGLHTLLALCSPGCYRIWTKKRSFSNHTTTMQRLFMTQFKQGLKGLRSPASIADKVFSLPYSVGRVLSIWSQHGPPGCPLEISALHSRHSKWQPSLQTSLVTTSRLEPPFSALVPKSRLVTGTPVSKLLLSASEFQVSGFDELDGVTAVCPRPQSPSPEQKEAEPEKRPKKVSQIRIRKTIPKPDPNLTPMGLPRPKRLKKKEFSLEEIYTNKNYKSPPANRCLETIFEEPKERNGTLISISQQKRKRVLEFQDFTVPRKRRARGKVKVAGSFTRAQKAALQSQELDALLIQKLMELETFFAKEEEQEEQASSS